MKKGGIFLIVLLVLLNSALCFAELTIEVTPKDAGYETYNATIPDPFEPVNRAFFNFNDKLYFWFLKPAAQGYTKVVPKPVRESLDNFLYNLMSPVRMLNDLLQFKLREFVIEFARLLANTTIGIGGLFDPAEKWFNLPKHDEDFGQTLGVWGIGSIAYVDWPVLGPSCVRESAGTVVDTLVDPLYYLTNFWTYLGIKAFYEFNRFSFNYDQYQEIKEEAFDPYLSLRNIYFQHREYLIDK